MTEVSTYPEPLKQDIEALMARHKWFMDQSYAAAMADRKAKREAVEQAMWDTVQRMPNGEYTFAHLRIARPVPGALGARLATDLGGLAPGRTGFAPAGRLSRFLEVIASSFLLDQPFLVALVVLLPELRRCDQVMRAAVAIAAFPAWPSGLETSP